MLLQSQLYRNTRYDESAKQMISVLSSASASSQNGKNSRVWMFASDELATKTNASYDSTGKSYVTQTYTQEQTTGSGAPSSATSHGQSFKVSTTDKISAIKWKSFDSMTGYSFDWTIEADSGGVPSGTALASRAGVTGPAASTWQEVAFDTPFTPAANTTYWVVARKTGGGSLPTNMWTEALSNVYADGSALVNSSYDMAFGVAQVSDITLVPSPVSISSSPALASFYFLLDQVDSVVMNTDIKVEVSFDGGSSWSGYGNVKFSSQYDGTYDIYACSFSGASLPSSGTSLLWRLTTYNKKRMAIRGAVLFWEV